MLNAIIIEDEKLAMDGLEQVLSEVSAEVKIAARLCSVRAGISFLSGQPHADLIFSDIQLPDGLSFDIFAQTGVTIPVIFITGYENYIRLAFENNGIDYLLKPVAKTDLQKALLKYKNLKKHFTNSTYQTPVDNIARFINQRKKTRLLVKKGMENIALRLEEIALVYTQNKLVYVIDRYSKKYTTDKSLSDLEEQLDNTVFFRVNRQYIVNINYVKSFRAFEKVKLLIDIIIPEIKHSIIISQETAPAFRKWMHEA